MSSVKTNDREWRGLYGGTAWRTPRSTTSPSTSLRINQGYDTLFRKLNELFTWWLPWSCSALQFVVTAPEGRNVKTKHVFLIWDHHPFRWAQSQGEGAWVRVKILVAGWMTLSILPYWPKSCSTKEGSYKAGKMPVKGSVPEKGGFSECLLCNRQEASTAYHPGVASTMASLTPPRILQLATPVSISCKDSSEPQRVTITKRAPYFHIYNLIRFFCTILWIKWNKNYFYDYFKKKTWAQRFMASASQPWQENWPLTCSPTAQGERWRKAEDSPSRPRAQRRCCSSQRTTCRARWGGTYLCNREHHVWGGDGPGQPGPEAPPPLSRSCLSGALWVSFRAPVSPAGQERGLNPPGTSLFCSLRGEQTLVRARTALRENYSSTFWDLSEKELSCVRICDSTSSISHLRIVNSGNSRCLPNSLF